MALLVLSSQSNIVLTVTEYTYFRKIYTKVTIIGVPVKKLVACSRYTVVDY